MKLLRHSDPAQFLAYNQTLLEESEAENSLILGLATRLTRDGIDHLPNEKRPLFVSILDGQKSVFCCLQTPPYSAIVAGKAAFAEAAIPLLCDALLSNPIPIPGINGPKAFSQRFAETWAARTGTPSRLNMDMRVYQLDAVQEVPYAAGTFRQATLEDQPIIAIWSADFHADLFTAISPQEAKQIAHDRITAGDIYVWELDEIVSMAASSRPTNHGVSINYVYTPLEHRKKGYASQCVTALSSLMLETYSFCTLFTDLSNPTSNRIYQEIGYYPVTDFHQYDFDKK